MARLASFMDRFIDEHPVIAGCSFPFAAACMAAFVIYTG